jgi:hypothetical protein
MNVSTCMAVSTVICHNIAVLASVPDFCISHSFMTITTKLPLLEPCCRWNSSSSSAAVMRLEVGRALMDAVRGCTGVLHPTVLCPCWWWIDSAELLLVVPADPPTKPSGSRSSPSSFSPPPSATASPSHVHSQLHNLHELHNF